MHTTLLFTNSFRKRRSFSDVNSWRSYEQCLFFSYFVCSVHVNMCVRMPVSFSSTTLPIFCQTSLCLMGSMSPSFLNICMRRSLSNSLLTTLLNATSFQMFGTFGARTYNQHPRLKTFRRTWSCKDLPRLFGKPSREMPVRIISLPLDQQRKVEGCEHPSHHNNSNKNVFRANALKLVASTYFPTKNAQKCWSKHKSKTGPSMLCNVIGPVLTQSNDEF